jgi:hypothetical protein
MRRPGPSALPSLRPSLREPFFWPRVVQGPEINVQCVEMQRPGSWSTVLLCGTHLYKSCHHSFEHSHIPVFEDLPVDPLGEEEECRVGHHAILDRDRAIIRSVDL